ncbi:hypothetical protein EAE99_010985 [Botrytis elliptica]|nr:hypothetical protein EAE99_010985 [Botrytis elliptica]
MSSLLLIRTIRFQVVTLCLQLSIIRNRGDTTNFKIKEKECYVYLGLPTHDPTQNIIWRRETLEELTSQPSTAEIPLAAYTMNNIIEARACESSGLSRRRSGKVDLSRIRTSWSEQPVQVSDVLDREVYNSERNYVDTFIQTDLCGHHIDEILSTGIAPPILPQEPQYQSVQTMPFG